mgnify:CR=1 FL=1
MGFTVDDKKLKRAGLDYWHHLDITYYEDLADFFAKNQGPFFYFTSKGPRRHVDVQYPDGAYLVAVGVYEALRQWDFADLETHGQLTRYEWSEDVK